MIKREVLKKENKVKVTFIQPFAASNSPISVVGDFNGWNPKANKLVKRSNGTASASITLDPGQTVRFRYVREDGVWFNDAEADSYEPSEHGTENCVITA